MPSVELPVKHKVGLHARPAALFVKQAAKFPCNISVSDLSGGAKGVQQGHVVRIEAEGEHAEAALQALEKLIHDNFGEAEA